MENNTLQTNILDTGEELFSWMAHDYHPHERGKLWYILFITIIGGTALIALFSDPKWGWITSSTILIFAALYFWIHKDGHQDHAIHCFKRGIMIDQVKYIKWSEFEGFWFIYNEQASIINLEFKGNKNQRITLQMGENNPDSFRRSFELIDLPELDNKKEATLDLWIRALKL
jgi:hypothetical protein